MQGTYSIKEAATMLQVSEQYLRDMIRFKLLDIGVAIKMPNKQNYHYIIFKDKLEKLMKGENNDRE